MSTHTQTQATDQTLRVRLIHSLFNVLHRELGRYASREHNASAPTIVELRSKLDAIHHDFTEVTL